MVEVRGGFKTAPRYFGRRPEVACGGPAPQALNFWPSCERRGGAATVLELRDRGEQGSRNPVLFGWLLTYGAQSRPVAVACCGGEWALLALALCALPSCSACCCCSYCSCCTYCTYCSSFCWWAAYALAVLPWLSSVSSCGVLLVQMPLLCSSISLQTRSNNRHAVAPGNRKRRRHRRPFSRAARPVPISFLQEVNL